MVCRLDEDYTLVERRVLFVQVRRVLYQVDEVLDSMNAELEALDPKGRGPTDDSLLK